MSLASRVSRLEQVIEVFDPTVCQCDRPYHYVELVGNVPDWVHRQSPTCPTCGLNPKTATRKTYSELPWEAAERIAKAAAAAKLQ